MLPIKASHPQAVYRVDIPAAHTALLNRLSSAIDKINASKRYPSMRVTQVGSWPWRMFLKQHMKSKGMPLSDALKDVLDSGDWDIRVEPSDDTITLSLKQFVDFVTELLSLLSIKIDIPFQNYFNMNWEFADLSIQCCQIKPINCYDINLNLQGEILFDDSLNATPGTHQNMFMSFIENKEIVTPHIYGTLESYKKSIEQKKELSVVEASRLYYMMKSYIKPLKMQDVHFHANTSEAWCQFMLMPETRDYYKQLKEKILKRYRYTESDYHLFETAVQKTYINDKIPYLYDLYAQLLHDLQAYEKIQGKALDDVAPENLQLKLRSLKTIQDVYDLDIQLSRTLEQTSQQLNILKQKSKAPVNMPMIEESAPVKSEKKPAPVKISPKPQPEFLDEQLHLDEDNVPVNQLVNQCLGHIRDHYKIRKAESEYAHLYENLWQGMFVKHGPAYRKLNRKQRSIFLSGLITAVQKEHFPVRGYGDMRDNIISYLLNTYYSVPMSIFVDLEVRRNYISGLWVWFELIKPFGVSDIEAFMSDFLADHQTLYNHSIKEGLIKEFEAVKQRLTKLNKHPFVKPSLPTMPASSDKIATSSSSSRITSYLFQGGKVIEKLLIPNTFYSCVRILMETEIMYQQATLKISATPDTPVLAAESFIRNILIQARYVQAQLLIPSEKEAFETFVSHFKFCAHLYRQLYYRRYTERLQVNDTLMPLILREALFGEKKPRTVEQLFLGLVSTYKKAYPDHEPSIQDMNTHSMPAIQAAAHMGNLLNTWDPLNTTRHKPLYDAYVREPHSLAYLKHIEQLMVQFANIQWVEPIAHFGKVYERFNSFMKYHEKQKSSNSLKLS